MEIQAKDKDFSKLYHKIVDEGIWAQLSPKAKALYPVHIRHADYTTRVGRPTVPTLAEESGINKGSVFKGNQELCKAGLMKMWKKDRRWYYHLFKKEDIHRENTGIYPLKDKKKPIYQKNKKTGRFIAPSNTVMSSPQNSDKPSPNNTGVSQPQNIGRY